MNKLAVFHQMDSQYAFLKDMNTLVIRIRVAKNDIESCILYYQDRCAMVHIPKMVGVPMEKVATDHYFDYFEVELINQFKRVYYGFFLKSKEESLYYINGEFYHTLDLFRTKYYQYAYIRQGDIADTPKWAQSSVMYQIFPDSFANGHRQMNISKKKVKDENGFISESLLGGTLKGISENIDYLAELGITALYMTPIFKSNAYHKYDIVDYFEIDSLLGTKEDFQALVDRCHQMGIKVILDGVFNHTSINFFAFDDIIKKGSESAYVDWYLIHDFPVKTTGLPNYEAFAYVASMPRTNTMNKEVVDYFCKVGQYWIESFGIDGWRLDVANEIDHQFLRDFRRAVRSVKSDCFIIGEIWEDAHSFLQGDQFDSAMNYPFTYYIEDYFKDNKITLSQLDGVLNGLRMRYKQPIEACMMNFLDSHDIRRFKTDCDEADFRLAVALQMTYPGVPCVYYGDELGFEGIEESEYRRKMDWQNPEQNPLFQYYKRLIALRKAHPALANGSIKTQWVDDAKGIYSFKRFDSAEVLTVLFNTSHDIQELPLSTVAESNNQSLIYGSGRIENHRLYINPKEMIVLQTLK